MKKQSMYLRKMLLLPLLLLGGLGLLRAQGGDVVKLKDGSVVRGTIVESFKDQYVRIKTEEGRYHQFDASEVAVQRLRTGKRLISPKPSGYFNNTSFGLLGGGGYYRAVRPSLHTVNGYQFGGRYSVGLGIGLETFDYEPMLPLFVEGRAYLKKGGFSPYVSLSGGYSFQLIQNGYYCDWGCYGYEGASRPKGLLGGAAIGFRKYTSSHFGINFSTGYRYQGLVSNTQAGWWNDAGELIYYPVREESRLHRLEFRFGIFFN